VIAILSVGCTRQAAAEYVGCHVSTIWRTAERDPDFQLRLRQAQSSHEILHLRSINSAAVEPRYWRAAAWALERSTRPLRPAPPANDHHRPDRPHPQPIRRRADGRNPDEAGRDRLLARIDAMLETLRVVTDENTDESHRRKLE